MPVKVACFLLLYAFSALLLLCSRTRVDGSSDSGVVCDKSRKLGASRRADSQGLGRFVVVVQATGIWSATIASLPRVKSNSLANMNGLGRVSSGSHECTRKYHDAASEGNTEQAHKQFFPPRCPYGDAAKKTRESCALSCRTKLRHASNKETEAWLPSGRMSTAMAGAPTESRGGRWRRVGGGGRRAEGGREWSEGVEVKVSRHGQCGRGCSD